MAENAIRSRSHTQKDTAYPPRYDFSISQADVESPFPCIDDNIRQMNILYKHTLTSFKVYTCTRVTYFRLHSSDI